jgi:hypothetical protein
MSRAGGTFNVNPLVNLLDAASEQFTTAKQARPHPPAAAV